MERGSNGPIMGMLAGRQYYIDRIGSNGYNLLHVPPNRYISEEKEVESPITRLGEGGASMSITAEKYGVASNQHALYEVIREAILSGRYTPGSPLREQALAKEYNVSRTPIRLSLAKLVSDGFAVAIPHVGVFVRKLDAEEMRDILEFRQILEAGAAAALAKKVTPEKTSELKHLAAKMKVAADNEKHVEKNELDVLFHRRVVELAGNKELTHVFTNSQIIYLSLPLHDNIAKPPANLAGSGHDQIVNAISSGDSVRAFEAMWNHYKMVLQSLEHPLAPNP